MQISTNQFKNGTHIEVDGDIYRIMEFQHVKPGKGAAFVRTKLKNVETGNTLEKTFRAGEKVESAHVDHREMQYIFNDGTDYTFMDLQSYEQVPLAKDLIGDGADGRPPLRGARLGLEGGILQDDEHALHPSAQLIGGRAGPRRPPAREHRRERHHRHHPHRRHAYTSERPSLTKV